MALFDWLRRAKPAPKTLHTTRQLLNLFAISDSIPCQRCRYDLKGLPPNSKCPECGAQALRSKLYHLSDSTGYSPDVFLFFLDANRQPKVDAQPPGPVTHRNAEQFYARLRDYALEQTGSITDAVRLFEDWGITRSEEIGALVYAMVAVVIFAASPEDRIEDFDGLPDVKRFFGTAKST
jgi:uncharacterized repeat protein (TIGR04138 family)